jgi:hypothetical protein
MRSGHSGDHAHAHRLGEQDVQYGRQVPILSFGMTNVDDIVEAVS